ncbi:hypothetical protein J6590_081220 [Homalodisca vitripennis]|nr:hypothetical protein J6590_081220 [Homalodisca vitripennis]
MPADKAKSTASQEVLLVDENQILLVQGSLRDQCDATFDVDSIPRNILSSDCNKLLVYTHVSSSGGPITLFRGAIPSVYPSALHG